RSSSSRAPVGVIAIRSPSRALTFPAVAWTTPSAASRRQAAATYSRRSASCMAAHAMRSGARGRRFPQRFVAPKRQGSSSGMTETTRRRFVAGALAAGAVAALPGAAEAKKRKTKAKRHRTRTADVCVVGAGFAGLTAARDLVNAGKSVVVLEARGVVGGRVQNHELGGGKVSERGGTFVGPTQDHVLNLASALGVDKFDTYDTGNNVYMA